MKKVIVAGAGHGGIVAGMYLARAGFDVTVFEQKQEDELGYDQYDSVHIDGFELAGLPVPEDYKVKRTGITFIIPGTDLPPLRQGVSDDTYNVEIDRKALYRFLIAPAREAGVNFRFGCAVEGPVLLGSRVVGLKTELETVYADLVIDAAGLYSPVRSNLPETLGIQNAAEEADILHTYRAFFTRDLSAGEPDYKYIVSLLPGRPCGIVWAITGEIEVDILIANIGDEITDEYIEMRTAQLKAANPVMGEFIRGGRVADIPVRQPLSMLVADGYAAIGDAAFMTIPLKGSGVGHSMRAGKILADTVIADEKCFYNRETLWDYQKKFFEEMGNGSMLMAAIKNELPYMVQEDLEYFFRENIISSELLEAFGNEAKFTKILTSFKLRELTDKARKIVGHPYVRSMLLRGGKNITRCMMAQQNLKDRYEMKSATKWNQSYNALFAAMRAETAEESAKAREKEKALAAAAETEAEEKAEKLEKEKEKREKKEEKKEKKEEKKKEKKEKKTEAEQQ